MSTAACRQSGGCEFKWLVELKFRLENYEMTRWKTGQLRVGGLAVLCALKLEKVRMLQEKSTAAKRSTAIEQLSTVIPG